MELRDPRCQCKIFVGPVVITLTLPEALERAIALHKAGNLAEAERLYKAILSSKPDHFDALHYLGVIEAQRRRPQDAHRLISRALDIDPQSSEAWLNHGNVLRALNRLDEALASYDRALAIKPDHAEALYYRGLLLRVLDRGEQALASYDRALAIKPDHADALISRGVVLEGLKRLEEALASYDQALAIKPNSTEALTNRGVALERLDRHEEALASFDTSLAINPDSVLALTNRGVALTGLSQHAEALESYDKALAIDPNYVEALTNRGAALKDLNRPMEALASYDRAVAIKPDLALALTNRGVVLEGLNRHAEALASYDRALAIKPDCVDALTNRAVALRYLNRHAESLASSTQALAIKPDFAQAQLNESFCRLLIGDFELGWEKYEWRWSVKDNFDTPRRNFAQPLWIGREDIAGKTILLHAEQGLGDTIQFCRYAQAVAEGRAAMVILEVPPMIKSLVSGIRGARQVLARGEPLPAFDFHCPLLSLPLAFGTRLETVPAVVPYLSVSTGLMAKWRARLGSTDMPRVGIVWSGRPQHKNDHNRSIALSRLLPLAGAGVSLISLQKEIRVEDQELLADARVILDLGQSLKDFSDTAALVSQLDLVVAVDTSVAHLAGALGRPVWILLPFAPDWRWLLDREDSPWYPTARLFRQPATGDWDSVIERVRDELAHYRK